MARDNFNDALSIEENHARALFAVADELATIGTHLKYLGNGDAATTMGAIEAHSVQVKEGLDAVAASLASIADNLELKGE